MAVISGLAPVDPFIMGLTQTAGKMTSMALAVGGVTVAAASNNFAKAFIALALADRKTGRQTLILMVTLTALGLLPWSLSSTGTPACAVFALAAESIQYARPKISHRNPAHANLARSRIVPIACSPKTAQARVPVLHANVYKVFLMTRGQGHQLFTSRTKGFLQLAVGAICAGLLLLPIWSVAFPPLLDYPNHLARAFVLAHLNDAHFSFAQFYRADWGAYPYLGMDASLAVLGPMFPIETAGRVYLSLCLLALPAAAWFFLRQAQPETETAFLWALLHRLQRFFSRRISEFRSEPRGRIFCAGIMVAMAGASGNRAMDRGARRIYGAVLHALAGLRHCGINPSRVPRAFPPPAARLAVERRARPARRRILFALFARRPDRKQNCFSRMGR